MSPPHKIGAQQYWLFTTEREERWSWVRAQTFSARIGKDMGKAQPGGRGNQLTDSGAKR
jgi:hypothetical protein